ncbi:MAG: transglutaminase domain-containing protein [Lachnospiraceae bacterium]|nr:transglutaminase domain-containing protein [Lachnospiraceae bacterium]
MRKKIYGTYQGALFVPNAKVYLGVKEGGEEFAQISFVSIGQMHANFDEIREMTDDTAKMILKAVNTPMEIDMQLCSEGLKIHVDVMEDITVDCVMKKISEEAHYKEGYFTVPEENIAVLKENSDYAEDALEVNYEYEFENPDVLKALEERGFERAKDKSFASIWKLYTRLCELYTQDGANYKHAAEKGTIAQMEHAEKQENYTNCRGISIIFAGVLRANGIKAFYEGMFSTDPEDNECHIVDEVFLEEYQKFVLFDPSMCCVYKLEGKYLNSIELKQALIDGRAEEIEMEYCNDKKKKSGGTATLAYYSKNMGHFERCIKNGEKDDTTKDNALILSAVNATDVYKERGRITTDVEKYFR